MTSPTPTLASAPGPAQSYRMVRDGVSGVLVALAVILLGVALYYLVYARTLGTVDGEMPTSWGQAFRSSAVWPVLTWSGLFGLASVAGVFFLSQVKVDSPSPALTTILAYILLGATVAMAAVCVYQIATLTFSEALANPLFLWALFMAPVFGVGAAFMFYPASQDPVRLRLTVMSIGGVAGFITLLLGFALPLTTYRATFGAGLEAWRENWPAVLWPSLAIFGSLLLMFLSLQLGQGLERQNQNVRRLIYGYNAVMTGLLLLAVLSIVNVLAYAEPFTRVFGRPFDWTAANINAISPAMRTMLADLKEPVKVYTFLGGGSLLDADMTTLLDNCRSLSPKFTWEPVSRSLENRKRLVEMMEKYSVSDPNGILVLVGGETSGTQPAYTFIKASDLVKIPQQDPRQPRATQQYSFIGESALLNALQSLLEGKMTIYFTEGHREWTAEGAPPTMPRRTVRGGGQLSTLRSKLTQRRGVEVRTLKLDRSTKAVPNDASVVVIVRPQVEFATEEVAVLRDYLRRQRQTKKGKDRGGKEVEEETVTAGRVLLLLEPIVVKQGDSSKYVPTGLESLLAEYNTKLGENRILSISRNPIAAPFEPAPGSENPIAKAFDVGERMRLFVFTDAQTVSPIAEQSPAKLVEKLFTTPENLAIWAESNFNRDPFARAQQLRENRQLLSKALKGGPLCVAVAVSDRGPGAAPRDAVHGGLGKDTPRMVVFGAAAWVGNESLAGAEGLVQMDLFSSCLSWLREKTAVGEGGTVEGKERKLYSLGLTEDKRGQVMFLPPFILALAIIGLGTGVWVVRRR